MLLETETAAIPRRVADAEAAAAAEAEAEELLQVCVRVCVCVCVCVLDVFGVRRKDWALMFFIFVDGV